MALVWANVKKRSTDRDDVVNLARMHQSFESLSHDDDVQVRRRERSGQLLARLVGKREDVGERMTPREVFDFGKFTTTAHETENDSLLLAQFESCRQQRIERMAGAMIPGIHDHELVALELLDRDQAAIAARPRRVRESVGERVPQPLYR